MIITKQTIKMALNEELGTFNFDIRGRDLRFLHRNNSPNAPREIP